MILLVTGFRWGNIPREIDTKGTGEGLANSIRNVAVSSSVHLWTIQRRHAGRLVDRTFTFVLPRHLSCAPTRVSPPPANRCLYRFPRRRLRPAAKGGGSERPGQGGNGDF